MSDLLRAMAMKNQELRDEVKNLCLKYGVDQAVFIASKTPTPEETKALSLISREHAPKHVMIDYMKGEAEEVIPLLIALLATDPKLMNIITGIAHKKMRQVRELLLDKMVDTGKDKMH